jgi:1-acyl-sn-glycerol-3-phosphate acyltransferase
MQVPPQPPADLLPVQREATPLFRFLRITVVPLLHALFRITVEGRERIPTDRAYLRAPSPYRDPGGLKVLRHRLTHLL